ncbi:MAG: 16S rRNA (guanine(966)-N(2))-methyltransferase RsmD [Bacteroidales bacterium]|jgi:16S rRNA (guanine(966)-N(2))-methyltransferase RsmD|nr:16S rRNA (guanine(966)-N(2))-methyltransferase RsmD [Bacteroidales bacterium]MDY0084287.1 16S rRNA (guanine(966)-N(2))-methyltransferase RsmD [Bacteroidales bacterium]
MRIIRGKYQRRQIVAPASLPVRPTTDMAKESLFNILENLLELDQLKVLDLFSGTGNIAYEMASRGGKSVLAIDQHPYCVRFIRSIIEKLQIENLQVLQMDVFKFVPTTRQKFDLIFADPPYDSPHFQLLVQLVFEHGLLEPGGLLVIEHSGNEDFSEHPAFVEMRHYGRVHFSFFRQA